MPKDVNQLRMKLKGQFPDSPRDKYQVKNAHNSEVAKRKAQILGRGNKEILKEIGETTGDTDIADKGKTRQADVKKMHTGALLGNEKNEVVDPADVLLGEPEEKKTPRKRTSKKEA
jgi:hypothetical protein